MTMGISQTDVPVVERTPHRTELGQLSGVDFHAQYDTVRTGGDFFDALIVGSRLIFLLTDIAGRRPETHTIAAETQDVFRGRAMEIFGSPDTNLMDATTELVHGINHALIEASHGARFAPTFVGCFDPALGVLAYINAGGQPAVFRDSDGTRLLPDISVPMGLFTHLTYEPSIQAFEAGAMLLVITKGVVEVRRGRTQFGTDRVVRLVQDSTAKSATEISRATLQATHDFKKIPWYSIHNLLPGRREHVEDLTALALVRPFPSISG
jgi:serine phosphatase RsbU (regulator of sigma subunit)